MNSHIVFGVISLAGYEIPHFWSLADLCPGFLGGSCSLAPPDAPHPSEGRKTGRTSPRRRKADPELCDLMVGLMVI